RLSIPVGTQWQSNSCAYDAVVTVLFNIWQQRPESVTAAWHEFHSDLLDSLHKDFIDSAACQLSVLLLLMPTLLWKRSEIPSGNIWPKSHLNSPLAGIQVFIPFSNKFSRLRLLLLSLLQTLPAQMDTMLTETGHPPAMVK
ncbi:hypothetical protein L208DRAFT_1555052, partial [Tricholoma matsutake]